MGRIKTLLVKRITRKLMEKYGDQMSEDYVKNKELVSKFTDVSSSKIRNVIAGYATRLVKYNASNKSQRKRSIKSEDLSKYYN
jgi:small subunit ribosomal protein S17e|tara:strand:+ start:4962 stop:5210 length:249 start_codon:yes stop_codon:yes gene_type:complete